MSQSTLCAAVLLAVARASSAYPVTVSNCGVENTYAASPTRAITMNQGATEFMLAMGLESKMVGTAYIDDAIWPRYAAAYASVPILSSGYPNETHLMAQGPDFIVGSYSSAFRGRYTTSSNRTRGIFSNATVGPCAGPGSDWGEDWTTCRPQLHAAGVGTYLFEDACENRSLRPDTVTEETVYEEMRALGSVFGVDTQALVAGMQQDFQQAAGLVASSMNGAQLKTVWLDCVGRCCPTAEGQEEQVFVGGGSGAPHMLMQEAGLENVFAGKDGNWVCVNVSEIAAASPDVIVVVDAAWDSAIDKIRYLYDDEAFCHLEVLRAARFVSIPFSATTLSPRNGPAAYDLAVAALHVRTGSHTATRESGVSSFSPYFLQTQTACQRCPLQMMYVVYDEAGDSAANYELCTKTETSTTQTTTTSTRTTATTTATTTTTTTTVLVEASRASCAGPGLWWWAAAGALAAVRLSAIAA